MTVEFQAIYENGVLRPITPLRLPESAKVSGTLEVSVAAGAPSADELLRQQEALDAMFQEIDSLPQTPANDELSNRDHDQILYGSPK